MKTYMHVADLALQCGDVTVGQVHEISRRIAVLILGEERGELYLREEQQIGTGLTGLIVVAKALSASSSILSVIAICAIASLISFPHL